jgi:cobalt-zinc-cadmium efflux system protein
MGHTHGHAGARHRWRLAAALGLTAGFLVVELVAALWSGSLALLSDAAHMGIDVAALTTVLAATVLATRRDRTGRRTFGSYRAEVLASGVVVLLMLGVSVYVLVAAVGRIGDEPEVAGGAMLAVGAVGLVVNAVAVLLLRGGAPESLAVRGAYLEVVADAAGSVGVIAAGVLVATTGQARWDTVVAVAIAAFVAVRAARLGREVLAVLLQQVPADLDADSVESDLRALEGVADVHDLHLWTLTSGMNVLTAHVVTESDDATHSVLDAARDVLRERHGVRHATLQVEPSTHTGCHEVGW